MNRMLFRCLLASMFPLLAFAQIPEDPLPRADWGAPPVQVSNAGGVWTIQGARQTVTLNASDLALRIQAGPATWSMAPSGTNDMLVRSGGREFHVRLADARKIMVEPCDTGFKTGVKVTLSDWARPRAGLSRGRTDLTLHLTVALEGKDEELVFDIAADEGETVVRRLHWPPAMNPECFDHTVLSNMRGALLPKNWPRLYHPIRANTNETTEVQSNVIESWSMSWWGFQQGKSALITIVETPDDAAYQFSHPAGGPTIIGPRWRPSLGKLAYLRRARMCFIADGNYVDMARRYRQYAMDTGLFVSLQEKIARKPIVRELIGTPLMRAGTLTNYKLNGDRYKRSPVEQRFRLITFDQRAQFFRDLKAGGVDRLTVVLTGWPRLGYDRQHPDVLPPAPAAGGYDGMKRLAATCAELGYLFSLHDQYRDYYVDAPSWDPQFAVREEDAASPPQAFPGSRFGDFKEGPIPFMDYWDGGKMSYLNGHFMLGHLVKNYQGLFDHSVRPAGNYLDVFGYVPPDEDFNPEHPITRTECLRERAKCYTWSRNNIGFVGTEAACDWTVPYADISSPLRSNRGIPVPLFNLVYHDAIMTTYNPTDLHGFLNAGVPQIDARQPNPEQLAAIRRMAALHRRVALLDMTRHEFLDANHRKERTTFSDGTTVTVDWDANTVTIQPDVN